MSTFWILIKNNLRLILRNKAFIFFMLCAPFISVLILNLQLGSIEKSYGSACKVNELNKATERIIYLSDAAKYPVKVYDKSQSELSEYILERLGEESAFAVYRYKASDMTEEAIIKQINDIIENDRIGVILYFSDMFDKTLLSGDYTAGMKVFRASDDERVTLFGESFDAIMSRLAAVVNKLRDAGGYNDGNVKDFAEAVVKSLNEMDEHLPVRTVVSLGDAHNDVLTKEKNNYIEKLGYAFAILTLGFLFCGVCVAYTVIEEEENRVYTRMMLSDVTVKTYLLAKLAVSIIISFLLTGITAVALLIMGQGDFGLSMGNLLLLVLLIGMVFSVLSLCVGTFAKNIMNANYTVFILWNISALFSGSYFKLDDSTTFIRSVSLLMPQKWFSDVAKKMILGDNAAYSMVLCITVAYLVVILSAGVVGLKVKKAPQ